MDAPLQQLSFRLASGAALDLRQFHVREKVSSLFSVELLGRSPDPDLDLEGFIGEAGRFEITGHAHRAWVGVVKTFEQVQAEPTGLSTYRVEVVPPLWLLTQRRNHRMFQRMTEPEIVVQLLGEWRIAHELHIDAGAYKKRDYRVQYGESDFDFVSRMLEDAGISYWFETVGNECMMVLSDSPQSQKAVAPLPFVSDASQVVDQEYVTNLSVVREVKPGKLTVRDVDFRIAPNYPLASSSTAPTCKPVETQLESFHYETGAFLYEGKGGGTPSADSKLAVRSSEREAELLADRRLHAARTDSQTYRFETDALHVRPGIRLPIVGHPRSELGAGSPVFITETDLSGELAREWTIVCKAKRGDAPFRPPLVTARPRVSGVETATVVGAHGDEIHTDEFGRIRVHFHWDRESRMNDDSSCWIPVSQPWGGTGYGGINLPRVGQEVIVDFLSGDPDRPIVIGRVYTALQPVPFKLPDNKTQSGWKSNSTEASGGYNEIMFEDAVGHELVRMQAEKDMHTLVKHDEQLTVQHDRTKKVLHDEDSHIGHDRTETVKNNETITIGANRVERVIANETLTVQGNRSRAVNGNEDIAIHANYSRHVNENASDTIGANSDLLVASNRSAQVGGSDSTTVGQFRSAAIGISNAITVGLSHSVSVAPAGVPLGSHQMFPGKTEITTGLGATITMEGAKITLTADEIFLVAKKDIHVTAKQKVDIGGKQGASMSSEAAEAKVAGKTLKLRGESAADLSSSGTVNVSGTPVELNGPGMFAGRVTEKAPDTITTGAALVLVGGASFPFPVTRDKDGNLHVGDHIIIKPGKEIPQFQEKTMRDLGIMSSTPNGLGRLNNLENNPGGHDLTIREYTAAEAKTYGPNNSLTYPGAGNSNLTYDAKGNPIPGSGSNPEIAYNPNIEDGAPGAPEPPDATLYHEMGHAEHDEYGVNRIGEAKGNGWDNEEEYQTIQGGVNQPGGTQVPGVPRTGSENDYLGDRGYPYRRTDHGSGYSNPDGSPIAPPGGGP